MGLVLGVKKQGSHGLVGALVASNRHFNAIGSQNKVNICNTIANP